MKIGLKLNNGKEIVTEKYDSISKMNEEFKDMGFVTVANKKVYLEEIDEIIL